MNATVINSRSLKTLARTLAICSAGIIKACDEYGQIYYLRDNIKTNDTKAYAVFYPETIIIEKRKNNLDFTHYLSKAMYPTYDVALIRHQHLRDIIYTIILKHSDINIDNAHSKGNNCPSNGPFIRTYYEYHTLIRLSKNNDKKESR